MSASPLRPDTAALAIRLLGGLQVRREGQPLPQPLPTRKTAALFAFLLLHPDRELSRDYLAGTFWPDVDETAACRSLSSALLHIRRLLEPRPEDAGRFLVSARNALQLVLPVGCWVDVRAFQQGPAEARAALAGSPEWFDALERAVGLYGGDLLPDVGDDWCTSLREELRQLLLSYLHELTRADQERHQERRASEWARRALAADPCDEESHRHLMQAYYRLGEHARAMQQYRECCRLLREELDTAPDAQTIALYQWLRTQSWHGSARGGARGPGGLHRAR